jgi:two-component system response regulator (stage 0 sporulation protein A)
MEQQIPKADPDSRIVKELVVRKLNELSVNINTRGGEYILEMLMLILCEQGELMNVAEPVRQVAERYGIRRESVRAAVRYAVINAWKNGNPEVQYRYFGRTVSFQRGKPTESGFILTLAMHLRHELQNYNDSPMRNTDIPPEIG